MSISVYQDIQADVSTTSYIKVNAKQNDSNSRYVRISCYNLGEPLPLQADVHSAFLRLRKADGYGALNKCEISPDGKIIAPLTEQMLAAPGTCCADLMIFDLTDPATGKPLEPFDDDGNLKEHIGSMLSTMPFYVNVIAETLEGSEIMSSDEFNGLTELIKKAEADYSCVMRHAQESATEAKSYAVGGTNSRVGEDSDNAKSYSIDSKSYAVGGTNSRDGEDTDNAKSYATNSKSYAVGGTNSRNGEDTDNAKSYATDAQSYAVGGTNSRDGEDSDNAKSYSIDSKSYANHAKSYAVGTGNEIRENDATDNASYYSQQSLASARTAMSYAVGGTNYRDGENEDNAQYYKNQAKVLRDETAQLENYARQYEESASAAVGHTEEFSNMAEEYCRDAQVYSNQAKSYAIGEGYSFRENEAVENAKYYYEQSRSISESFSGALRPMGTVAFSNLPEPSEAETGDMYNISDEFVTTVQFREGAGHAYSNGTNVYMTSDGLWDCLAGTTVTGVKGDAESSYRKGNVNITKEDLGLGNVNNTPDSQKTVSSSAYLLSSDHHTATYRPSDLNPRHAESFFSSLGYLDGNTATRLSYVDGIGMNGWMDSSGGRANALVCTKSGTQALYHYTGDFNGSSWSGKKQIAYMDETASYSIVTDGNFNNMTTPGIYTMKGSGTQNKPSTGNYHGLIVLRSDSGTYVQQIATKEGTTEVYVRYGNSSSWGSWTRLLKDGDTVSSATNAAQATKDGDGNIISSTYVKTTDTRLTNARTPLAHTHDDRYYTESEIDTKVNSINTSLSSINTSLSSVSTKLANISVARVNFPEYTCNSNALSGTVSVSVAKTGFTPLGIVGIFPGTSEASPQQFYISGTTAYAKFRNDKAGAITVSAGNAFIMVLYKQS